jgi:hypothetical protein
MKKKIVGILICMLISVLFLSVSVGADPGPDLEININGGWGTNLAINNVGDEDAIDVEITVFIEGGIFGLVDISLEHYRLGDIKVGDGFTLRLDRSYGGWVSGFGPIELNVTAGASNAEQVTNTVNGFMLFVLIII